MSTAVQSSSFAIPKTMRAWVLDDPGELQTDARSRCRSRGRPRCWCASTPSPSATATSGSSRAGRRRLIEGGLPFNKNFTPGHEYMGTVVKLGPGVDEFAVGDRVAVEVHFGCGRCERCRAGMYTSCLNYGMNYGEHNKGHRANGFTTDGGFAEYAVNNINTLVHVPDDIGDEEATLIVTAGTAMYALDTLGGLIAGQSLAVTGPGADRADGRRRRQGARRAAGDSHRHARCAPEPGPAARRRSPRQHQFGTSGRGGQAHHRRQGRALRARMLGQRPTG